MPAKQKLRQFLQRQGASTSPEVQQHLVVSQATVSRLMADAADEVIVCGKGKSTRYALAHPIGSAPSQQAIWMINALGMPERLGSLSFLCQSQMLIEADGVSQIFTASPNHVLPWYLTPLKAEGFLGRMLAHNLSAFGVPANPQVWGAEDALIGAIHTHDAPGAILLGSGLSDLNLGVAHIPDNNQQEALDALAVGIAKMLAPGSSAGGEQPKFLANNDQHESLLIKFSPPIGTPFGDRWRDLLRMEALASAVLQRYGLEAAKTEFVQTKTRAYLLSKRFDRVGTHGRLHVVSLGAVHQAFVKGSFVNWSATCDALVRQGRLPLSSAEVIQTIFQFGKLIGNSDMHFGNASLFVVGNTLQDMLKAQFKLAPVYDMLPMRWRPDPLIGISDYAPFEFDLMLANQTARHAARHFWQEVSTDQFISQPLKEVALVMMGRTGCDVS